MLTHRAAVLGKPIAHSLSPALHRAGYAASGLAGWEYTAIECIEPELPRLVARLGPEWTALSLTMPLKRAALTVAVEVAPLAAAVGAANTLVRIPSGWRAENTDAPGMVDALATVGVARASAVAVLGAGGTARAALAAARDLGASEIRVYARRAAAVDAMRPAASALGVDITHVGWDRADECGSADVVLSTVPRGVTDLLAPRWRPSGVLFDVVYDPWPTRLAAGAAAAGVPIVSGLEFLLHQAARQFQIFTGEPAPVEEMRAALVTAATVRRAS